VDAKHPPEVKQHGYTEDDATDPVDRYPVELEAHDGKECRATEQDDGHCHYPVKQAVRDGMTDGR
jgi:hypothetical protein